MRRNHCLRCRKSITKSIHQLCITCFNNARTGSNHPRWNVNRVRKCLDCDKSIKRIDAKRCKSCAMKNYLQNPKNHSQWKGGKPRCIVCTKEINYGSIKCQACELHSRTGKNHWNWKHGKSKEPYSYQWTEQLKERIRARDKYSCQLCTKAQTKELKQVKRKLPVHHIDYNKENCNENNLITLCLRCNTKVNQNRTFWTNYFRGRT